jgi:rhamnogalacturonan endolyase
MGFGQNSHAQRIVENLGRGAIAIKTADGYFVSWRLLGTEYGKEVQFNLYRDNKKRNSTPLHYTCFFDTIPALSGEYTVSTIIDGKEKTKSKVTILPKGYLEIPLKQGDYSIQHAWPGDLDGDGEYDFIVSRLPLKSGSPVIEGYLRDGTFLWRIDMGPNSIQQAPGNGANDSPPASISGFGNIAGYRDNDNITVYDLNLDGKAEVFVRTAPGVTFADGKSITDTSLFAQYISVINGLTGKEITRTHVPTDFIQDGPIASHFGVAYLDGIHPSLITKLKNREGFHLGNFNLLIAAWDFDGLKLTQRWKWVHKKEPFVSSFHQIRIIDLNQDGKDEICGGSFVINNDGKFLYSLDSCVHGDRFHITDMDPDRPGLEGYGIQQTENGQIEYYPWYYYDASKGKIIRNGGKPKDVGRGMVADIDPRYRGYEMWSANGVYAIDGTKISEKMPVTNFKIWWDADLLGEILDRTNIYKWNYKENKMDSLFSGKDLIHAARNAPPLYGDLFGDWREEVLWEAADHSSFRIYSTTIPTDYALYTLPHNPAYRACLAVKGYYQSNLVDYYLGDGMKMPSPPKIQILK